MSESFKKIKKKHLLLAILKTAIIGFASGLGGVGVAFLVVTLGSFDFQWFYYLLLGLGILVIVSVPVFLKEFPSNKSIARKLDADFGLKERVQTMVEYSDSEGDILSLQRKDTNERLKKLERKSISFKEFLVALIVAVICLSIFASGLAVSFTTKAEANKPSIYDEPKFDYSINRQNAMLELIDNVKNCGLNSETKNKLVERLTELHSYTLEEERTLVEVKTAIAIAVGYIDIELEGLTTYRDVHSDIVKIDTCLANGIVSALDDYKQYASQFTSFANITRIYEDIVLNDELLASAMEYFENAEERISQTNAEDVTHEQIKQRLETFVRDANHYLSITQEAEAESDDFENEESEGEEKLNLDALINSFIALKTNFEVYKDKINGYTDLVGVRAEIHKYFTTFYQSFSSAMLDEIYPCIMQKFIRNKICAVYQISKSDLPEITPDPVLVDDGNDPKGDEKENQGSGGGGGTGDTLYASNDEIYDPDQAKYVKYGEILAEHEAKMQDTLMSSDLPEDVKKAILAYFQYIGIYNQKE